MTNNLTQIGTIFVDAGMVMVGDPSFTLPDDAPNRSLFVRDWDAFCEELDAQDYGTHQKPFSLKEAGIVVQAGHPDGEYPVFIEQGLDGTVKRLVIEFTEVTA